MSNAAPALRCLCCAGYGTLESYSRARAATYWDEGLGAPVNVECEDCRGTGRVQCVACGEWCATRKSTRGALCESCACHECHGEGCSDHDVDGCAQLVECERCEGSGAEPCVVCDTPAVQLVGSDPMCEACALDIARSGRAPAEPPRCPHGVPAGRPCFSCRMGGAHVAV